MNRPAPKGPYPNEDPFFGLGDLMDDIAQSLEGGLAQGLDQLGEAVGIADTRPEAAKQTEEGADE